MLSLLVLRYTISEVARREVLGRLPRLNHERHAEKVAAGLVDERGKPLKRNGKGERVGSAAARGDGVAEERAGYRT